MNRTKIEWCDSTWNPVTGCYHDCEYCYARRIAERFSTAHTCHEYGDDLPFTFSSKKHYIVNELSVPAIVAYTEKKAPYPFGFQPTLHRYKLDEPKSIKTSQIIFVCSMADLFGSWVPDDWIKAVFDACRQAPQHVYMFLTKNPARYIELHDKGLLPKDNNFWYGSTVTNDEMPIFFSDSHLCFVSIEPMISKFKANSRTRKALAYVDWIIIGAMTGPGSKEQQPKREWVETIVSEARKIGAPVFMKNSLREIWGEKLLRENPVPIAVLFS